MNTKMPWFSFVILLTVISVNAQPTTGRRMSGARYTLDNCVNQFMASGIETTSAGYQYWFADRWLADGKTVKLSVVRPHEATHEPHAHAEDEFFFVLEGTAELFLDGKSKTVGPNTSFYSPPFVEHGIRNAGDSELKYLVIKQYEDVVDAAGFWDSSHHWYDIVDEDRTIAPESNQQVVPESNIKAIADNILLYQKSNGGWPKNYDMLAVLNEKQKKAIEAARNELNTTIDNGATHSHIDYLAKAHAVLKNPEYKDACARGIDFVLSAQYPNGGWPQYFPDTSGYRNHVTFNDGAMVGVMKVLQRIVSSDEDFAFLDDRRRDRVRSAFKKGLKCILSSQIRENGELTVWCQQHHSSTLQPASARSFEPAAMCSMESAEIVEFLMSIEKPSREVVDAVHAAVRWFERAAISGIRVKTVDAPKAQYQFHATEVDRVVVQDPSAPRIWSRFVELKTGRPLFCNRDGVPVYSLAEVERERRTGYAWYSYDPERAMKSFKKWQK